LPTASQDAMRALLESICPHFVDVRSCPVWLIELAAIRSVREELVLPTQDSQTRSALGTARRVHRTSETIGSGVDAKALTQSRLCVVRTCAELRARPPHRRRLGAWTGRRARNGPSAVANKLRSRKGGVDERCVDPEGAARCLSRPTHVQYRGGDGNSRATIVGNQRRG